jgi:hypothetical protein
MHTAVNSEEGYLSPEMRGDGGDRIKTKSNTAKDHGSYLHVETLPKNSPSIKKKLRGQNRHVKNSTMQY